jgi:HK97 family phage major capsid protein
MFALGTAANIPYANGAWVMTPRTAIYLSTLLTAGNVPMWPDIGPRGGTWFGLPVVVSAGVPIEVGSPTSSIIVLVDASEIFLADDDVITLDVSNNAALQMDSAPSTGAQNTVSMWQTDSVALRANRFCNWTRRSDAGAIVLTGVSY